MAIGNFVMIHVKIIVVVIVHEFLASVGCLKMCSDGIYASSTDQNEKIMETDSLSHLSRFESLLVPSTFPANF